MVFSESQGGAKASTTNGHQTNGTHLEGRTGIMGTAFRARRLRVIMLGAG